MTITHELGLSAKERAERTLKRRRQLIVISPANDEEETIADVIQEIPREIKGISSVEVLVLDDGSVDNTVANAWSAGADYVISHNRRLGLARTFRDAVDAALERGADIIVNTDADNHYDQSRIPELIEPIIQRRADIVVGSRNVTEIPMKWTHKWGNVFGSFMVRKLVNIPDQIDVSSGFRAYDREAALRLNVIAGYTYTHETLIAAMEQGMTVTNVTIGAREVKRPSRLIEGVLGHVARAGAVILRSYAIYQPIRVFSTMGILLIIAGLFPMLRFLYFYLSEGTAGGHIQSLIAGSVMIIVGFQVLVLSLLASAVSWNRRMLEELLVRERRRDYPAQNNDE
jgi:glycosyltransferase involved in cell wall biosynthesis